MISPESLVLIGAVALVIFGPKKLPEIGKAAGKTLREFKKATQDIMDMDDKSTPSSENKPEPAKAITSNVETVDPKLVSTPIDKQE